MEQWMVLPACNPGSAITWGEFPVVTPGERTKQHNQAWVGGGILQSPPGIVSSCESGITYKQPFHSVLLDSGTPTD